MDYKKEAEEFLHKRQATHEPLEKDQYQAINDFATYLSTQEASKEDSHGGGGSHKPEPKCECGGHFTADNLLCDCGKTTRTPKDKIELLDIRELENLTQKEGALRLIYKINTLITKFNNL